MQTAGVRLFLKEGRWRTEVWVGIVSDEKGSIRQAAAAGLPIKSPFDNDMALI